jgi:hypothetical protein
MADRHEIVEREVRGEPAERLVQNLVQVFRTAAVIGISNVSVAFVRRRSNSARRKSIVA